MNLNDNLKIDCSMNKRARLFDLCASRFVGGAGVAHVIYFGPTSLAHVIFFSDLTGNRYYFAQMNTNYKFAHVQERFIQGNTLNKWHERHERGFLLKEILALL